MEIKTQSLGGGRLRRLVGRFCRNRRGATAVEYGLIAAGISVTLIVSVTAVGDGLNKTFTQIGSTLSATQAN